MTVVDPNLTTTYDLVVGKRQITFGKTTHIDVTTGASGVYGGPGVIWSVTNTGLIEATGFGASAISLAAAGAVVNAAGATIYGYEGIVVTNGAGVVTNSGTISGTSSIGASAVYLEDGGEVVNTTGATIRGLAGGGGVTIKGATGAVTNAGAINGYGAEMLGSSGVALGGGGTVTNSAKGSIYGVGGGVDIYGGVGSVTNYGKIAAAMGALAYNAIYLQDGGVVNNGATGIISASGDGVLIAGGPGTVTNAGSITNLAFAGSGANKLTLLGGSTISGSVSGSGASGATNLIVLEGKGAASAALFDFGTIDVTAGSNWSFDGASSLTTTLELSGDLTILGAASSVFTLTPKDTGTLTLGDTAGAWQAIAANDTTVDFSAAQASVVGSQNTLNLAGTGNQISLYDTANSSDVVKGSSAMVFLTDSQASVTGGGDTVEMLGRAAGDQMTLYATAGDWDTVTAGTDASGTIHLSDAQASVFGGGDTLDLAGAKGNAVSLYDTENKLDVVNGSNATLYLTEAQASVTGGGEAINMLGTTRNDATLRGTASNWDIVTGSGGTINLNDAQASVFGADTIAFQGDSGNAASLYDTGASSDSLSGSDGIVYLTGAQVNLHGDNDTISMAGGSVATVTGTGESFVFNAAIGQEVINGFSLTDTMRFATSDFANWQVLSAGHITQSGANTVISFSPSNTVTLDHVTASSLTSSQFRFG